MRPRKSRIFYDGKYFDYPLKAVQRPAQPRPDRGGPLRRVLRLGPRPAAEGPDQLRGLARRPLRLAPLPHVLQDLHREGVGRAGQRDARRLGRAAGQGPVARQRDRQRAHCPKRNQKDITSLIEEFQYPKYGPGMMWEGCRDKVVAQGSKVVMRDRGHQDRATPTARPSRSTAEHGRRRHHRVPGDHVISSMPISAAAQGHGPAGRPPRCRPRPTTSRFRDFLTVALVVPEPRRSAWTDNWIYIHDPDGRDHAHPELRLVVAVHGEGRPQRPRPRVHSCSRATRCGPPPTRS